MSARTRNDELGWCQNKLPGNKFDLYRYLHTLCPKQSNKENNYKL